MTDPLVETWEISARINGYLLDAIPAPALDAIAASKGRTVGEALAHIHNVRLMWLKAAAPDLLAGLDKVEKDRPRVPPPRPDRPRAEAVGPAPGQEDRLRHLGVGQPLSDSPRGEWARYPSRRRVLRRGGAVGLFDRVLGAGKEKDPAQAALRQMDRALGLYRAKRFQEALDIADALIAAGPSVPLSWRFRGECLFSLQRYAEAVAAFDKAAALGGKGTDDLFLWSALALHNGGKPDEAMQRLRAALANPKLSPELRARADEAIKRLQPAG